MREDLHMTAMRPQLTRRAALALAAAAAAAPAADAAAPYCPTATDWATRQPQDAGFDPSRLDAVLEGALVADALSLMVLRGGRIAAERYARGWGRDETREIASCGKSMVSVLTGMAIDDGKIRSLDQKAADFITPWRGTPKEAITIRHLLSMTSGVEDRGLSPRAVAVDQFARNAAAPLRDPPGTRWHYNTATYHLMFHLLARATGERFEDYARRRLVGPLGMARTTWLTNQGQGADGPVTNYYSAICSTRDLGRFGLFAQRGGMWAGKQLVDAAYFRASIRPSPALNPAYGLLWWENREPGSGAAGRTATLRFPGSPVDTFAAMGAGGQLVMVVPSKDLVVVRQGEARGAETMAGDLLRGVVEALRA